MNKTTLQLERPELRQVRRADLAPASGYAIVVDGRFKTEFVDESAAKKAAAELLAKYPMLKIEVYDATSKSRTLVRICGRPRHRPAKEDRPAGQI
ncbi:hypothetical protein ACVWZL_007347 [Bradyrhizobium sp. GM2.4]